MLEKFFENINIANQNNFKPSTTRPPLASLKCQIVFHLSVCQSYDWRGVNGTVPVQMPLC